MELSEEERRRRSELMRRLNAEGRAGAKFGRLGGRPRKRPSRVEEVSRQFRERAERQEAERRAFVEAEMRKNTARARALKQETRGYPSGGRYLPIQRP